MLKLSDLRDDSLARLPQERRKEIEGLIAEYGGGETFSFLLVLTAVATRRERHLLRLFLRELEKQEPIP